MIVCNFLFTIFLKYYNYTKRLLKRNISYNPNFSRRSCSFSFPLFYFLCFTSDWSMKIVPLQQPLESTGWDSSHLINWAPARSDHSTIPGENWKCCRHTGVKQLNFLLTWRNVLMIFALLGMFYPFYEIHLNSTYIFLSHNFKQKKTERVEIWSACFFVSHLHTFSSVYET